ncbi:dienelactone hydrolase family protein [Bordetella bronchiseptica]|uniref:dienelactone hydrolase family protein n=1 Tax=Bordetella bronchiseptica TaxID=518 RepID=UPI000460FB72|nr:dienelactone hydrolase family protein [Bordetella bronchiseptica]KDC62231.1 putative carboxymethylenebutenolidase [Bordetella bronchiseptica MBORD595]VEF42141.1 Carboxymethylenebutenolidase [Bordetella bronchiseptica]
MTMITLKTRDGQTFEAYHAPAPTAGAPGLVLIQEIFGINLAMRAAADQWARLGFDVLCPDLFWRQEPGVQLDPTSEADFGQAVRLMQAMDENQAIADLDTARAWLAERSGGKVAGLGYCLGGRLAVRLAMDTPVQCAVSYYGVMLDQLLPTVDAQAAPTLLHVAEQDRFVPPEARAVILEAAGKLPQCEAHVYEGCDHAFARPGGEHWDAAAAALAEERSVAFMQRHLA